MPSQYTHQKHQLCASTGYAWITEDILVFTSREVPQRDARGSDDPGVRNFVTVYDPDGRTFCVSDARSAIEHRFKRVDALKSKLRALAEKKILQASAATSTTAETTTRTESLLHREHYRLRRKIRFTLKRITRMIRDMHHEVLSWLLANYHKVLLPAFQISEMTRVYKQNAATGAAATVQPVGARRKLSSPSCAR